MSFEIFFQVFIGGEDAGIPLDMIRSAFGRFLFEAEEDFWQVRFDDGQSCDLFLGPLVVDSSLVHNISFHRPCRDVRLYEGIWSLLGVPGAVLYFPDCDAPLTRDALAESAMPQDLLEALGDPVIVLSPLDIIRAITASNNLS